MRHTSQLSAIGIAALLVVSGCAGSTDATADGEVSEPITSESPESTVSTTSPTETLPLPEDPQSDWASQVIDAWSALLAANETAIFEYLEVFDGYTPEEVTAYRDLVTHPAIADAVAAFPGAPDDADLAGPYDALLAALAAEVEAGEDAAAQIDAHLEDYQAAAASGQASDYDGIREGLGAARDASTRACLDLAAGFAERDLGTLDCIEGPDDGDGVGDDLDGGAVGPPVFDGEPLTIVSVSDHSSDEPTGSFTVTNGADALGCRSGTWTDVELSEDAAELTTEFACEDGSRSGTMVMAQYYAADTWWEFTGGDGDFTGLGGGGSVVADIGEGVTTVTFDGNALHADGSE